MALFLLDHLLVFILLFLSSFVFLACFSYLTSFVYLSFSGTVNVVTQSINHSVHIQLLFTIKRKCCARFQFYSCFCVPGEGKEEIVKVTFGELRRDVALFAAAMRKMGIQTGDRVVGEFHWLLPQIEQKNKAITF